VSIDFASNIHLSKMAIRFITCKSVLKIFNQGRKRFATNVHKVANEVKPLSQLVDRLKAGLPATNLVYVCARNALNNKILSNFYTDGWPDFSSVICQIHKPRMSDDSDLLCYSNCKESILSLMKESGVITWGRWQVIEGLKSDHADHLIDMLQCMNSTATVGNIESRYEGSILYYPYKQAQAPPPITIPGFILDKIRPCHLKHVFDDFKMYPDREPHVVEKYFDHVFRNFRSVAIFKIDNLTIPLGWIYTTAHGGIGFHYVSKEFRGKGISYTLRIELGRQTLESGDIPMGMFDKEHVRLAQMTGLVELHSTKKVVLTEY
jgi:hypothetical protein